MQGWNLSEAKQRCEVTEITLLLEQGQLAGYARPSGVESNLVAIPQSAWTEVDIVEENGACLLHRPSKTELLDLRIYPILHAPDAPELLHGRGLGEVFMTTVVNDPEVAALGRRVMAKEGYREVFLNGNAPGPVLDSHWLVDWNAKNLANAFINRMVSFWDDPVPSPSAAIMAAAELLADRMAALRALLSSGRVGAMGTHRISGQLSLIHRAQWSRADQAIDVKNGDLCDIDPNWTAIWTGIILECPGPPAGLSLDLRFQQIIENKAKSAVLTIAAATQCRFWLQQLVRENPAGRVKRQIDLRQEAQKNWPGLSGRGFDRAWASATTSEEGEMWSKGGRPRKTPAPKTSAPK